ncbi:WD40-repeat-containing domain protein, partial [Bisporella sp. PMI_857]
VTSVAFSPDGKQIVSGSGDRTIQIWDAVTGAVLQTLKGHLDKVTSVAFSPDSKVKQGLFVSNYWILVGKERILWLSPEYRQTYEAVWGKVIVLAHLLSRISILELKD